MPTRTRGSKTPRRNVKPTKAAKASKTPRRSKAGGKQDREVVHPKVRSVVHDDDKPITVQAAMKLLGWVEESTDDAFGNDYLLKRRKSKVRCTNNVTNRPLYKTVVDTLRQEILRGRWRLNGEPIIIGKTGQILNGQHTLIALVLAGDSWRDNRERYHAWEHEPVLHKVIVYGIDEDDNTVNTMDTCKPRGLKDVLYRSPYFDKLARPARKKASAALEFAIRKMWLRTGSKDNPDCPRASHSEMVDFLEHHRRLVEAVLHVAAEDGDGGITKYLRPGAASALLYLMAASDTDPEAYYATDQLSEANADLGQWEKACEFFVELANGGTKLNPVRTAYKAVMAEKELMPAESEAILIKAWHLYSDGKTISAAKLKLEYEVVDDQKILAESPLLGGIDVGAEGPQKAAVSAKEVKATTAKIRKSKAAAKQGDDPHPGLRGSQEVEGEWSTGDKAWVAGSKDGFDEPYFCTLTGEPYEAAARGGRSFVMVETEGPEGGIFEVETGELSLAFPQPTAKG